MTFPRCAIEIKPFPWEWTLKPDGMCGPVYLGKKESCYGFWFGWLFFYIEAGVVRRNGNS